MEWLNTLLHNTYFVWCAMAIILFGITQLIKWPIKHFTKKIGNKKVRTLVNTAILLIPFAFGILLDFLYSTYYLKEAFNAINGLGYGMAAISLYGIIERFLKIKVDSPYDTADGKSVTELIYNLANDGKLDAKDAEAIQEFLDNIVNEDNYDDDDDETDDDEKQKITDAIQEFLDKVKK